MGWGEAHTAPVSSPEVVRGAQERMSADSLAAVVAAFLASATTSNRERMAGALDGYRGARCAA